MERHAQRDHENDTADIQAAFAAAGPGGTVQLTAGHFYVNSILVQGFYGTFTGASEGQTVIDCLRGLNPSLPGVTVTPDVEPFTFLFGFRGGNVNVSAMSFNITAPEPAEHFFVNPVDGGYRTDLGDVVLVTGNASSAFDRVSFTPGAGDMAGLNVAGDIGIVGKALVDPDGIWISFGATGGVHSVTRCSFAGLSGVEVMGLTAGRLIVGGCAAKQNAFDEYWEGCFLADISNSYIEISHNHMTTVGGQDVFAVQGWLAGQGTGAPLPLPPAPRYVVTDNDMRASGGGYGVFVGDNSYPMYGAAGRLNVVIADNTIVLADESLGIGEWCTKNIKVLHNYLCGSAMAGIYVGDDWGGTEQEPILYRVSGWKIIGNDLRNLTASVAPIILGEGTTDCVVVCPTKTDVLDKGVDNILINAYRLPWSP